MFKNETLRFIFYTIFTLCVTGIIINGCNMLHKESVMSKKIKLESILKCQPCVDKIKK
jgi:hypothetical protein